VGNTETIEVRLLGGLHVVRPDGSLVEDQAWRTTKSADLFRLLALSNGRPVPVDGILEKFWPDAEHSRARASLRTALTHVRRAVGHAHVVRTRTGIVLEQAWVDVDAYRRLAVEARTCVRTGRHPDLVRLGRESESLWTDDFHAADDDAPWVVGAREALVATRTALLADAAESAVALRWLRDAVDFAEAALRLDPGLEHVYRALMRAYAGLGETDRALRAFERCRRHLATTLGADPSPLTASVHRQILTAPPPSLPDTRLVGRDAEVARVAALVRAATTERGPTVVRLTGAPGSGRDAVLDGALRSLDPDTRSRVVVSSVWDERLRVSLNIEAVLASMPGDRAVVTVLTTSEGSPVPPGLRGVQVRDVPITPLGTEALAELAREVLAGPVSPSLVSELLRTTGGRPGQAVRQLYSWSGHGAVVWTSAGLEVVPSDSGWEEDHVVGSLMRDLRRRSTDPQVELVQVLALLPDTVTAARLADLGAPDEAELQRGLDRLTDAGVLVSSPEGYRFSNPRMRDATRSWTRPSVAARLHRRLVAHGLLPDEAGVSA
jgi:DNA-binding SARP family transcriptional activator